MKPWIFAIALVGCGRSYYDPPGDPTPIEGLNTPYDDFNLAAPWNGTDLVFATNREGNFDLWTAGIRFPNLTAERAYPLLKTEWNEFGPSYYREWYAYESRLVDRNLVFSSDRPGGAGKLDLYIAEPRGDSAMPFPGANTTANESYWAQFPRTELAMFASDRGGKGYDLYEISPPLGGADVRIRRIDELSSDANDTAPCITTARFEDKDRLVVVFASDRAGGKGGYDLWVSAQVRDRWIPPVPLEDANSPADDFRSALTGVYDVPESAVLIIFSSNRPGGKGGFDLYLMEFEVPTNLRRAVARAVREK